MLLCGVGEALLQGVAALGLGLGFFAVELTAAGVDSGVGAEEETLPCSEGGAVLGFKFGAKTDGAEPLVVGLVT